ncbi:MarR family transcriptional regulator [Staphylococcus condimenti]|uniref:HTH-type transcriptional regulator SarZ n=2 Tax=Staphylococcus condimenti TaxID=70255 RepID=A0AB37H797_9STAP|nr:MULTISPECIES: MarR family transcriptional regulator [Staphylococcus]AMY06376.1 MarR family transcriptional regulator [Staphylococcus condimenti]APR60259.1 MarR family transcriptional regulator [Staphylococcus condimenti]MDK8644282.1 MarR family transcriptional regulator [Staphylococcus condimenti]OFP00219.1 MarR family transcriptional regulator [Staphylococcus sp. HMSC065E08]PNZ59714.1 MarR family transcriptional regulator [Staphylococcus condimenti]
MYENNSFLEKQLCFLFYVSSKEIIKRYSPYLKKYDLTYTGYIVLLALEEHETLNIKTLGKRVFLDSGTLTPLLKKLEKKELVTRKREEDDERNLKVALTQKGIDTRYEISDISKEVFSGLDVSFEDAKTIKSILSKFIVDNFSKE